MKMTNKTEDTADQDQQSYNATKPMFMDITNVLICSQIVCGFLFHF